MAGVGLRLRGAEHPARTILCLHANVWPGGAYCDGRLKALSGSRSSNRLEPIWTGSGEHLPASYLRGPVPAGVERQRAVVGLDGQGRIFVRLPAPREAKGPVGFDLGREAGVEEQIAISAVLGEERIAAPTDEDVAVRQHLHAALGAADLSLRVRILTQ